MVIKSPFGMSIGFEIFLKVELPQRTAVLQ